MLALFRQRRRMNQVVQGMLDARRRGLGLYLGEWTVCASADAAEPLVLWARRVLGESRRPYGIDHFDLAIAYTAPAGATPDSLELRDLHPSDLYGDGRAVHQISAFIERATRIRSGEVRMAAALYSWGDAAHHSLPRVS